MRQFVQKVILPKLKFKGYKISEKRELAAWAIRSLIIHRKRGGCTADSRDTHKTGVALRVSVWETICTAGFADIALGSELSKRTTRYRATDKLMDLRRRWTLDHLVDLKLNRNSQEEQPTAHALVCLRKERFRFEGKKRVRHPGPREIDFRPLCGEHWLGHVRHTEDAIEAFNHNNLVHSWMFFVTDPVAGRLISSPLNPCVRQIHYGGKFYQNGMRFHGWSELSGQFLSKEERKTILIDGEPAIELDFSGSQIRTMYHWRNIDPDPNEDIYLPHKVFSRSYNRLGRNEQQVIRGFVKDATLRCLNVASCSAAHSSVGKLLATHEQKELIRQSLSRDQLDVKGLVKRITRLHQPLKEWFFAKSAGLAMTSESQVMFRVMKTFTGARKPLLPIHDAVVCKSSDAKFAKRTLMEAYQYVHSTRFKPVIKKEF
jgi:hypothetical protein